MDTGLTIEILLAICLLGFIVGIISHKKLISEGGLPGLFIKPANQLTSTAQIAKKWMLAGYGTFLGSIALMLAISFIWGPAKG